MAETQQSWAFRVGNGATPTEVFTQLPGLAEIPEFTPNNRTLRAATTIADVQTANMKKQKFNRLQSGQELALSMWFLPGDTVQDYLLAQEGLDAGINCQFEIVGEDQEELYEFNALVLNKTFAVGGANDEGAVDMVNVTLVVNSEVERTRTAVV